MISSIMHTILSECTFMSKSLLLKATLSQFRTLVSQFYFIGLSSSSIG